MAGFAFALQLALNNNLGRNARVISAGHPQRVVAQHAVVARERIHDGLIERVAHVQRARDIGGRELNRKRRLGRIQCGVVLSALLPHRSPVAFNRGRFKRLVQAVKPRCGGEHLGGVKIGRGGRGRCRG